jgi:hypothetical protein
VAGIARPERARPGPRARWDFAKTTYELVELKGWDGDTRIA